MLTETKYFGAVEYDSDDVLIFPNGIFGFEEESEFLLLPFENSDGNMLCLQSIKTPSLAFVAMNPFALKPDYSPVLQKAELEKLQAENSDELCYYTLCVVREPVGTSTVNLRCPIVINDKTKNAMQVILETDEYNMRHSLAEFESKEGQPSLSDSQEA